MKYFTFAASILTLFFVCQETLAQVQPNNISNQVDQPIEQLEKNIEEPESNKKDDWDRVEIVGTIAGTVFTPIVIAVVGIVFNRNERKREAKRKDFEEKITNMNIKARQAELISKFMDALTSKDPKIRTLGIKAISLALPEESKAFTQVLSQQDEDDQVKSVAEESLKILLLKNLVRNEDELKHLYRLYEGEKLEEKTPFNKGESFMAELRNLRTLGLIENQSGKTIGGMPQKGEHLEKYVKLTQDGTDYIQDRERYGLANPRREENKNSDFWAEVKAKVNNDQSTTAPTSSSHL